LTTPRESISTQDNPARPSSLWLSLYEESCTMATSVLFEDR
jgi:hypothetical protein